MQQKRILEYIPFSLEKTRYSKELLPVTLISLLMQLNNLSASWTLTPTLQKLEILECENDSSSQCIAIGIKLRGWVDPELLKHRMSTLVQNWSKHLPIANSKEQDEHSSTGGLHWSFVDLKGFSASEQRERMQQHTSKDAFQHLVHATDDQIHIYVYRLHSDTHMFQTVMRQRIPTISSVKLLHELLDALHTQKSKISFHDPAEPPEHSISAMDVQSLTTREIEILRHISGGLSNREIAQKCCIAEGTVKRHINNIYVKLNVGSRTQAVARAQTLNLLPVVY